MSPDPNVLKRIAEGHYAGVALEVLGDLLDALAEETLRRADALRESKSLTPEISLAIMYELGAYRTIGNRLRQKVRRAENDKRAAEAQVPTRDDTDVAAEEMN